MPFKSFVRALLTFKKQDKLRFKTPDTKDSELALTKIKEEYPFFTFFQTWADISKVLCFEDHEDIIEEYQEYLRWDFLSCNIYHVEYIKKYKNRMDWYYFCTYVECPEEILEEYFEYLNILQLCKHQNLSKDFIQRHPETFIKNKAVYHLVLCYQYNI